MSLNKKMPKIALAAWAIAKGTIPIISVTKVPQVEDVVGASEIELTEDEIARIEKAADEENVNTIRFWEKVME